MLRSILIALLLATALPVAAQDEPAESAAAEAADARPTGLMPRQERMLREGRGMGLARAAEMNGYPGPRHVLEQAEALELTDEQRAASAELMARVRQQAPAVGERILAAEAELNAMFADGTVTREAMEEKLAEIADLNAELRAVHLNAHLDQAALLTDAQKAAYEPMYQTRGAQGQRRQMRQQQQQRQRSGQGER
jgi:Spy/CpxP family protein refolding chaperone